MQLAKSRDFRGKFYNEKNLTMKSANNENLTMKSANNEKCQQWKFDNEKTTMKSSKEILGKNSTMKKI